MRRGDDAGAAGIEMKGIKLAGAPLYLDMQATTPLDPRVLDAMLPFWTDQYGNPHSRTHYFGWETEDAVEVARKQVADLIGEVFRQFYHYDTPASVNADGSECARNCCRNCDEKLYWLSRYLGLLCILSFFLDISGADPKEIIFTSGATESNNLAIKGVANFYKEKKNHIITTQARVL